MTPTSFAIVLYGSVLVNMVLGLVLILIVGSYQKLLKAVNSISRAEALEKNKKVTSARTQAQDVLTRARSEAEDIIKDAELISTELREGFSKELAKAITDKVDKQITLLISELKEKIESQYQELKDKKLETAQKDIDLLVKQVAKEVISKSVNPKDHSKLIQESLESARQEGMFT